MNKKEDIAAGSVPGLLVAAMLAATKERQKTDAFQASIFDDKEEWHERDD